MKQIMFSDVKVHNEIKLCQVSDKKVKTEIERLFLKSRISYFERWERPSFFQRLFGSKEEKCTICVNEAQKEKAVEIVKSLVEGEDKANLILQKVDKIFF